MPNTKSPVTSVHTLTKALGVGRWEELKSEQLWLFYGLLTAIALASIVGYARFTIFGLTLKHEGREMAVEDERHVRELLGHYGEQDSLGYFATRRDKSVIFSPDATAAITYRVLSGISLASADPVGSEDSWAAVIREWLAEAAANNWIPAVMASSERGARQYQKFGFKALQLGDEAVIDVRDISSVSGRPNRVQKAALRLQLAGYTSRIRRHGDIPATELYHLSLLATQWRGAQKERVGFSMNLSRFGDPTDDSCILIEALDPSGTLQGFLSLVPWGRCGLSLDLLCRSPNGKNGLSEFMIVELAAASSPLGVTRISLTFVMFRSVFDQANRIGAGPIMLGYRAALRGLSRFVQLESLYRFTVKCEPQWYPRFACFRQIRQIPKITWMCLSVEGFLPEQPKSQRREGNTVDFRHSFQDMNKPPPRMTDGINEWAIRRPVRIHVDKLDQYRNSYDDPYKASFVPDSDLRAIREQFTELPTGARSGKFVKLAGRVVAKRDRGRLCFLVLVDLSGKIQAIVEAKELGYARLRELLHIIGPGDLLGVCGEIVNSRRRELSILVREWVLTAKCLHPFPRAQTRAPGNNHITKLSYLFPWEANEKIRLRCHLISVLRLFLEQRHFLEIETPVPSRASQGSGANPRIKPRNVFRHQHQIVIEQYLKSLRMSGISRTFEIKRGFRTEDALPPGDEFIILEACQTYIDYLGTMDLVRQLVQQASCAIYDKKAVTRQSGKGDWEGSEQWQVLTVHAAVAAALQCPITVDTSYSELHSACKRAGIEVPPVASRDQLVICAFKRLVEPATQYPTFYIDYPVSSLPLTRQHRLHSRLAERWGLVAFGVEIATSSSELTDPIEYQRSLPQQQSYAASKSNSDVTEVNDEFLLSLQYGMPPRASFQLSIHHLLDVLTSCPAMDT